MPFKHISAISRLARGACPPRSVQPLAVRMLSSTPYQFTEDKNAGYIGEQTQTEGPPSHIKNSKTTGPKVTAKRDTEDPSTQPGGSKAKDAKDKDRENNGSRTSEKTEDQKKAEEEEKEYRAEVEQHNKEFEEGYDRVTEHAAEAKDDEKFWKGILYSYPLDVESGSY